MKAISLWQPWASLMAIDAKRNETRSWPTTHRGWIAIHAAKKWDEELEQTCLDDPFRDALQTAGFTAPARLKYGLPVGAIIAVVNLTACVPTHPLPHDGRYGFFGRPHEREFGDYSPRRYAWITRDVIRLPEPVPCRGMQGLFNLPGDVHAQVLSQINAKANGDCPEDRWKARTFIADLTKTAHGNSLPTKESMQ
jgi:hypothetical protein